MSAVSPSALVAMLNGKDDDQMVFVTVKESNGHRYEGRVTSMQEVKAAPRSSTVDVEATDGEMVWAVPVYRVVAVDVRPFQRYSGYGVAQFVSDFGTSG